MVKLVVRLLTVFILMHLAACSVLSLSSSSTDIIKSDNDDREYRYITLPNQMRVLLVSDSKANKAAASLDINVGTGSDPKNYQGLAHFLEHMLFLGTEKYPEAGAYQSFINAHGGNHNAYTSFEHTNYFFDVDPAYLEPTLDRFAQFFVAPLFTEAYVEREKNAVHSEYMAKIKEDNRKSIDVFKQIINPAHPFAKLGVGNLETLSVGDDDDSLRDQLIRFYDHYYSANIMTLVVLGNETTTELEAIVRDKFQSVKNTNVQLEPIEAELFTEDALPLLVKIKPEKAQRTLSIAFPTDSDEKFYRQKPLYYLGNILGHEGKGSLLSYLKQQGWADGLSAGQGLSYNDGATFNIGLQLTEKGLEYYPQVVEAVYQSINRIKASRDRGWLFDEQKTISEQNFLYQEKTAPLHTVSRLSAAMHYYDRQDFLRGAYLMTDYDAQLVDHYLDFLNPENSLLTLSAADVETDQTTYFYQADYGVEKISDRLMAMWTNTGLNPEIVLPEPNPFIAKNLQRFELDINAEVPQLIVDEVGLRVWFKQAEKFTVPKGSLFFSFRSPLPSESAENTMLLNLLAAVLTDELNELSYPATLAGLNYSLRSHSRGFILKINGFNDKQALLLERILAVLDSPNFDPLRFEDIKKNQVRSLKNADKQQPYYLIMDQLDELLAPSIWSRQQLLSAARGLTLEQLKAFRQNLFTRGSMDVLAYGNYRQQGVVDMSAAVSSQFYRQPVAAQPIKVSKIPAVHRSLNVASDYTDASLLVYLQATGLDKSRRAAMGVTAQMLRSEFYTSLRTEKQLGYIVSSGAYPTMEVPGLFFLVQSPVAGPKQLQQEIDQFLQQRFEQLDAVSQQEFDRQRNVVILRLLETPQNLWQQSERYWQDIIRHYYQFDFRQQLVTALEDLTLQQWRDFFVEDVIENQRRLLVYTEGKFTEQPDLTAEPIEQVPVYKSTVPYYSFQ